MRPSSIRIVLLAASVSAPLGCSRPTPAKAEAAGSPAVTAITSTASSSPSAATPTIAVRPTADASAEAPVAHYPVGATCATAAALAKEKRGVAPSATWRIVDSLQGFRVRAPGDAFPETYEDDHGLHLVSDLHAEGLGPGGGARPFAMRFLRVARSVDELLADKGKDAPLAGAYLDDAFPKHTAASFVAQPDEPMHSGSSARTNLAGHPAYVWIGGVEGYDTDYVLVELGARDTLVVTADWNSAIMGGQPECWQRAVIGAVLEDLEPASFAPDLHGVETRAGRLTVESSLTGSTVRFGGKVVVTAQSDDAKDKRAAAPMASLVETFGPREGFDDVALLRWDGPGNACAGYGFTFVGLEKSGAFTLSDDVPWCGGPGPRVTLASGEIRVVSPAHAPNHGAGKIPAVTYVYAHGKVRRTK